jgi:hemerythrin-like metal-binding protein
LTAHKALHHALVKKVLEFQKELESGSSFLAIEVMQFLQKWLTEHIQNTDQKYGQFLNGKGVH